MLYFNPLTQSFLNGVWDILLPTSNINFTVPFNVTNLSSPSRGLRPRVVSTPSEVVVAFSGSDVSFKLFSRDMNLSNDIWEANYVQPTGTSYSIFIPNLVAIGNTVYCVAIGGLIAGEGCLQSVYSTSRSVTSSQWSQEVYIACNGGQTNSRERRLVVADGLLRFCNVYTSGVVLRSSVPGSGTWTTETVEGFTGEGEQRSSIVSSNQFGTNVFWKGTFPTNHLHVRRKPSIVTGNIAERTFLTGNNWISTTVAAILSGVTVDARAGSITTIMQNSWLNVYGTLNVNPASGGRPAALIACETGGEIIVRGGQVNNNGTINPNCFAACILVSNFGGNTGQWFLGDNNSQTLTGGAFLAMDGGELSLGSAASMNIGSGGRMEVRQASTFTFGSSSSITVNGTMEVWDNTTLSLPSNSVVYANSSAQIKMGNGASIYTEGKFHAVGTAQSPVVVLGNNGAIWNGITAQSGNSSGVLGDVRLEHVSFSNANTPVQLRTPVAAYIANVTLNSPQIGMQILPNYLIFVQPPPPPTMQINNATINGAYSYGITVENFSDLVINSCTVTGNQGIAGISLTGASPKILGSTVSNFEVGIWGVANSAPLLFDQGVGGFNVFTSNMTAAQFEGSSHAALGIDDGIGGQNSFTQYLQYAIVLQDNSIVNAEWNWYDTPDPTQSLFEIKSGSKLYWEPYLTSPPGGNAPVGGGITEGKGEEGNPQFTSADPRMRQVLHLRVRGRHSEAATLLRSIVGDRSAAAQLKRWAIGQILAVSQNLRAPNLASYLVGLQSTMPQVRQYLAELLPGAYIHERAVVNARSQYENNIRNHGNSITEAQALYGKFSHALFGDGDRTEAQAVLTRLQSRFANSAQSRLAAAQLNATPSSSIVGNGGIGKGKAGVDAGSFHAAASKPSAFALRQNYPNPFNPTTTFSYDLKDDAFVTLKVFDLLGREAATIVNESQRAGRYSTSFDASRLASGVYVYKLSAGSFSAVRRFVLLK
jgi:hypothetical protein